MKYKKTLSFIFYALTLSLYLFLFKHTHSLASLILFAIIFLFFRKNLAKKFLSLERKMFFLTSLVIYHLGSTINITESLTTIQLLILSRKTLSLSLLLFLVLAIFWMVHQDIFHLSYIYPSTLASSPLRMFKEKKEQYINLYDNSKDALNRENIKYLVTEIPRHGYINYTSQYNLSEEFFKRSTAAIEKNNRLYIILSKTGSPASEVISLFTNKDFNHLSLSFDRDLQTMLSYNGGNDLQKPGLNAENLNSLQQKEDSHIRVYSLKATKTQQYKILNKIQTINNEGSAYNVVGLVTSHSVRPNIMFCSQFVYSMFQEAELTFFDASHGEVKPTDFIEKDQQQQLTFEYEISHSNLLHEKVQSL